MDLLGRSNDGCTSNIVQCQAPVGKGICGETATLDIINQLRHLYEDKMKEIDGFDGGDNVELKLQLQQEWIKDLIEQNEMLVKAVESLEIEATERVNVLEQKLQQSASCICEVMNKYRQYDVTSEILAEPLEKIFRLENDKKNLLEFMRRVREEQRWDYGGLNFYEISFKDLFGNEREKYLNNNENTQEQKKNKDLDQTIKDMEKELKCTNDKYDKLKQTMAETRQALAEEVAQKHDTILQLKREIQDLEDRCIRADKQTAFRDDIIKELRKEIKQLKQQLTQDEVGKLHATIDELQKTLENTKKVREDEDKAKDEIIKYLEQSLKKCEENVKTCKICKGKSKVGFLEHESVQVDDDRIKNHVELIHKRDEIIKVQNETLDLLQKEMENLKLNEVENVKVKEKQAKEIENLTHKISELEQELKNSETKAGNLQTAVDLYQNSINVLEATEEKYKLEISQQKSTISNLQKALVTAKQSLDEARLKSEENDIQELNLVNNFVKILTTNDESNDSLLNEIFKLSENYDRLQELNLELELEHCYSLQDLTILETQIHSYRSLSLSKEKELKECKIQLKKLTKQKMCYEEVVAYFQKEMTLMAEQLHNLQELLTLSHSSVEQETANLQRAFLDIQTANQQLTCQLTAAEQKVLLENQMNRLNESKINELEKLLNEKNVDISRHAQAIDDIRQTLKCSLKQNEELLGTIVVLNGMIGELQGAVKKYEKDNVKSKESTTSCQEQIDGCKRKLNELRAALERKTAELCRLEMAYNDQCRSLNNAEMELREMRDKQDENRCHIKCIADELREKLCDREEKLRKLKQEHKKLEGECAAARRRECVKDLEIKRYRKIVGDLKRTLADLNESLIKKDFDCKCQDKQEECLNCPCEIEFYQSIVDIIKKTVLDWKKKLFDTQQKNEELEHKCKCTEELYNQLTKSQEEKDKEYQELRKKLNDQLKLAQCQEYRYGELGKQFEKELNAIKQELEARTLQLCEVKKSAQEINSSRCMQLACAQEEVNKLKEELNALLRKHNLLNIEHEKLHAQSIKMHSTIMGLEENSQLLKGQLEHYISELQTVQCDKETLVNKNKDLLVELRNLQSSSNKQQRLSESVKALEQELGEVKRSRDEITFESRNVVNYFRCWLQEQKKINEFVVNREREYLAAINRLKQENEELQCQCSPKPQSTLIKTIPFCLRTFPACSSPPPVCQSPWSLGSQGTASYHDRSPATSPCPNEDCDWYSSNFKNYSEDDNDDDEDWVSKVEDLAAQVRRTNKMWKRKLGEAECGSDCAVSKDNRK